MSKSTALANKMRKNCDDVSRLMKALAHPQRLMILCHLTTGEKTVGEVEDLCGASQSAVSQFLSRMRLEGLVQSEKRGKMVYYSILDPRVLEIMTELHRIFCK
ncbi:MAG: metalloregulator ArsR/SmtB family transcription factor [Bdellovibrionales bacterium]|nr:metalloregulator ArsR/SmtB family transcription factor [Bdellovibrionales bacterium]